ncbi:MAG: UDP-4-amino-4-deoxy-L-arabinose-oxoglutarate aminotransferase [Gammaproteobacteria bacterium RIFCSPHIGHO2_02_FULL_42_13]|nr:MAG: UDP-4-amino-4-deoxy-L-arabinose-oxoglutarate aminotransferase [Gammaproteobacteria bacterium RIFCSPHIGHO2_02_FULL_42_13]OGT68204.1 MAG: UDP-4-amino-4-deoxy-L-arabinose-oxoglutarate aminotransferase [Gammaproteobacteria bacterium RIFCSPLOWO2_02_FULL_42_9]
MHKPEISIVVPIHNEQEVIESLYERLTKIMDSLDRPYEIILVNDGSTDNSATLLNDLVKRRPKEFRIIHFSGNYGQHMAIMAGFENMRGEVAIMLDADMQTPPEEIPKLVAAIDEGHDVVNSFRLNRQDHIWRKFVSKAHNIIRKKITPARIKMEDEGSMLRAYRRNIVKQMTATGEKSTFITALAMIYAVNPTEIGVKHAERTLGTSSYNLYKLIRYNFDMLTNFSLVPLQMFTLLGIGVSAFSILFVIYLFIRRLIVGPEAEGVFTLFAIAFFIMGLILLGLGIIGEYVGRIYQESQKRPRFVIQKIVEAE